MSTTPGPGDEHGEDRGSDHGPEGGPPDPTAVPPTPPSEPTPPHGGGDPPPGGQAPPPGGPPPGGGWAPPPAGGPPTGFVQQTNGLAIGGLIASIVGLVTLWLCGLGILGLVPGLVLGFVARNQIRSSGGRQSGEGLALAAIIVGGVGLGLAVLWFLLVAVFGVFGAMMPAGV